MTFEEARAQFPVLEKIAYLNAGTFGPISRPTYQAVSGELERDYREGRSGGPNFVRVMEMRQQVRARIAALVGAEPLQVTLTTSTTEGCNIVLGGLGLGPNDEIVTTTDEHFGLLGALATSGARIVVVAPDADAIRAAVTPRTRLLALSQVIWTTGRILASSTFARRQAFPCWSTAPSPSGRFPSLPPDSTTSRSRARSGSAGLTRRGLSSWPTPSGLRCRAPQRFADRL